MTVTTTERELFRGYRPAPAAHVELQIVAQDHALRVVIEERIAELLRYRRWYRLNRWADWSVERRQHTDELRALVRLAREARRVARAAAAGPAPDVSYHDWQAR